jgi:5'-3' exonuclease
VALFESDAQMAWLAAQPDWFHGVMADDQDMLVHGVTITVAAWKPKNGSCVVTDLTGVSYPLPSCGGAMSACAWAGKGTCKSCSAGHGLSKAALLSACCIAGTDYWEGLSGYGIKRACKAVRDSPGVTCI